MSVFDQYHQHHDDSRGKHLTGLYTTFIHAFSKKYSLHRFTFGDNRAGAPVARDAAPGCTSSKNNQKKPMEQEYKIVSQTPECDHRHRCKILINADQSKAFAAGPQLKLQGHETHAEGRVNLLCICTFSSDSFFLLPGFSVPLPLFPVPQGQRGGSETSLVHVRRSRRGQTEADQRRRRSCLAPGIGHPR